MIKSYFSAGATFRLEQSNNIPHGLSDDTCQKKIEGLLRAIERSMMSPLQPFFPEWISLAVIEIVLWLLGSVQKTIRVIDRNTDRVEQALFRALKNAVDNEAPFNIRR